MRTVLILALLGTLALGVVIRQQQQQQPNERISYKGHSIWKIYIGTDAQAKFLLNLETTHGLFLDFWLKPKRVPGTADIRVSPQDKKYFKRLLTEQGLPYEIKIDNLESLLQSELASLKKRTKFEIGHHPSKITLDQNHDLDEIMAYLDSVVQMYPTTVTKVSIGNSLEGRAMQAVKIGNPGMNKPAVMIEGCIHAREWLATATMLYIINELTVNAGNYKSMLDAIDVYVLPVTNPDGYVYTWTTDRMWRKTRSGPRKGCYGVDPNRNWNFEWMVAGSSNQPCSEEYAGPSPASEIEVQNLQNFLGKNNDTIKSYFDIHTYSEDFMYPYGYAENAIPADVDKLKALAGKATAAVNAAHGQKFAYGSIIDIVYPASGSSIDYTKGVLNIDYSYAMELRPDGNALNGFILPDNQILDGASECWAGVSVVFNQVVGEATNGAKKN